MTVLAFPLDPERPLCVLGRDDAKLVRQSGLNVDVACLDATGRPFVTTFPIYRLRLGKRAASPEPQPAAPREEDRRPQKIADAFRAFAEAMAGGDRPSDSPIGDDAA